MTALAVAAILALTPLTPRSGGTPTMECDDVKNPAGRSLEPIRRTFDAWRLAIDADDVDGMAALVTEDAEFWGHEQPALRGREAARAAFASTLERWSWDQAFECRELVVGDGFAVARGVEVNRLESREGEGSVVRRQRAFSLLREGDDGVWRFSRGMTNAPPPEEG